MKPAHLCPQCGSSVERIQISATESRCAECGVGGTSARLVAISDPANPVAREEGLRRLLAMEGQRDQAFVDRPFPVYGLGRGWTGLRSFTGWGRSDGVTTSLSLAFGDPSDEEAPLVRIETSERRTAHPSAHRFSIARSLVMQHFGRLGPLPDPVRAAAFPKHGQGDFGTDPTGLWDDATIPVESMPRPAKVLAANAETWIALLDVDELLVAIGARRYPLDSVGLVEVTDFAVYAEGSVEIRERMTRRTHLRPPVAGFGAS